MRAMYPNAGLVLTEFGAESTMTGPASEKQTYAFQELYTRDVLAAVRRAPTLSGAIYWTLQEFAVKPQWDGGAQLRAAERTSIHHKGLITYDGRPKPAYDVLRKDIKSTPLVRPEADVALALDTRVPDRHRGRVGFGFALAILIAVGRPARGRPLGVLRLARRDPGRRPRDARAAAALIRAHRAARAQEAGEPAEAPAGLRVVA